MKISKDIDPSGTSFHGVTITTTPNRKSRMLIRLMPCMKRRLELSLALPNKVAGFR